MISDSRCDTHRKKDGYTVKYMKRILCIIVNMDLGNNTPQQISSLTNCKEHCLYHNILFGIVMELDWSRNVLC